MKNKEISLLVLVLALTLSIGSCMTAEEAEARKRQVYPDLVANASFAHTQVESVGSTETTISIYGTTWYYDKVTLQLLGEDGYITDSLLYITDPRTQLFKTDPGRNTATAWTICNKLTDEEIERRVWHNESVLRQQTQYDACVSDAFNTGGSTSNCRRPTENELPLRVNYTDITSIEIIPDIEQQYISEYTEAMVQKECGGNNPTPSSFYCRTPKKCRGFSCSPTIKLYVTYRC